MFVDVVPVVRQLVPGLLTHRQPSVARVRTTRAKYLVFDTDPTRPACVVEFGDAERLHRIDGILSELHWRCPGAVPRPLVCAPWGQGTAVHIQEGLPGVPWFRVADGLPTVASWESLLDRTLSVMRRLHLAIAGVPAWVWTVSVQEALAEQVRLCRVNGGTLAPHFLRQVETCADRIGGGGTMAVWQHGDFSLNNLMVSPEAVAVIDFEEFGLTRMPLHDAFGLALSFPLSQGGRCPIPIADCVERSIGAAMAPGQFDETTVRALLLHHLLWRINQSHGHPTRAPLRARLASLAERVAPASGNGLSAITLALAH